MEHFKHTPTVEYTGNVVLKNIFLRARIRDAVLKQGAVFYEYTIQDSDRPDIIASKYYGNSAYTWILFYANDIFDPIHDWPKTTEQFYAYIKQKYGSIERAKSELEEHHHYLLDDEFVIDRATYFSGEYDASRLRAVSHYDYEFELNEAKRNIKIMDATYMLQINNEFKNIFVK